MTRPSGKNHYKWQGLYPSYTAVHSWIQKHYGKANKCEQKSEECAKRFEWANISGKYKRDRKDFKMLCSRHHQREHRQEDYGNKYGNNCKNGHEFTKDNTYVYKGYRQCKRCKAIRSKLAYIPSSKKGKK